MSMTKEWRSNAKPRVDPPVEIPALPVHGGSLHDEGAEVAPICPPADEYTDAWARFLGCDVWIEWRHPDADWHGQRVEGFASVGGEIIGLMLRAIDYRDEEMGGWCCVSDANQEHEAAWADIESIRLLTDEEKRPPVRDSRIANEPARPSLPGDSHYSVLPIGPLEVTEKWAPHWPSPSVVYPLGEALAMIARCGTRGQAVRDLRKAAGLLTHAADFLERES